MTSFSRGLRAVALSTLSILGLSVLAAMPAMAAPSSSWSAPASGSTSVTVQTPPGQVGDELFLVVVTRDSGWAEIPSGWEQVSSTTAGGVETTVLHRTSTQAESGAVTVAVNWGNSTIATVLRTQPGVTVADIDTGSDTTRARSYSALGAGLDVQADDLVVAVTGYNNDTSSVSASLTEATSVVLAAPTHPVKASSVVGSDISLVTSQAAVTTGGSMRPKLDLTIGGGDTAGGTGHSVFLALRPGGTVTPPPTTTPPPSTSNRVFQAANWLYTPIRSGAALDSSSATWVNSLASQTAVPMANVGPYGVPIHNTDGTEQRYQVSLREDWGTNPFIANPAPLRSSYVPSSGTDGAMSVIDRETNKAYDFWQYAWNNGQPVASWGDVSDLAGDGNDSGATGAGLSRAAGVVTTEELAAGVIDHALVFSSNRSSAVFRYPATKSDGNGGAIPEGARFQLDPAFDINTISDPKVRAVARALQLYGAYNIDNGGHPMALIFESSTAGWNSDYQNLTGIPLNRMRVLAAAETPR